jgi:D-ribose pyranase
MYHTRILNPSLNELLGRIRHTNLLVISDKGFPFWPQVPTIDISLVDDQPSVPDVLEALLPNFTAGSAWMATEFKEHNHSAALERVTAALGETPLKFLSHDDFKKLVPGAVGLIRTGGTASYSNIILESA